MFARSLTLALILLLAGCGGSDARAPFTDSRPPPNLGRRDWPPPGWTWGLIKIAGMPPQRYGVAAPNGVARGQVLILPGYGGAAEDTFPLANALVDQDFAVWALDGAGQGGGGRAVTLRDLGHVDSFDGDLIALHQLIGEAIRPAEGVPLLVVADTTAAMVLLRRLELGEPSVAGVVLRSPTATAPGGAFALRPLADWARRLGVGFWRAPGGWGWRRLGPEINPALDPDAVHAWRMTNPQLRMGGPSLGWLAAFNPLIRAVDAGGLSRLEMPVLIIGARTDSTADRALRDRLCRALAHCVQSQANTEDAMAAQVTAFARTLAGRAWGQRNGPQHPARAKL